MSTEHQSRESTTQLSQKENSSQYSGSFLSPPAFQLTATPPNDTGQNVEGGESLKEFDSLFAGGRLPGKKKVMKLISQMTEEERQQLRASSGYCHKVALAFRKDNGAKAVEVT